MDRQYQNDQSSVTALPKGNPQGGNDIQILVIYGSMSHSDLAQICLNAVFKPVFSNFHAFIFGH